MRNRRALGVGIVLAVVGWSCAFISQRAGPATVVAPGSTSELVEPLPNRDGSLKFAVLGDFGVGTTRQYGLATQMAKLHETFAFESVLMVGDNIYGADRPQDYVNKF